MISNLTHTSMIIERNLLLVCRLQTVDVPPVRRT